MSTLILYLSATGNTERIAEEIANKLGDSDLLPITLKTKIPANEFWLTIKFGFLMRMHWGFRYHMPPIDITKYDSVIIGTPVWMGKAAPPLMDMVNRLRINNKIIGAFATSGVGPGSVFENIYERIHIKSLDSSLSLSASERNDNKVVQQKVEGFIQALKRVSPSLVQTLVHER